MYKSINDLLASFTMKGSFWALFLSKLKKRKTHQKDLILAVGIDYDNELFLEYNFENLIQLDDTFINDLLQHECHHILNKHFLRIKNLENKDDTYQRDLISIAADLAVNSNIPTLPTSFYLNDYLCKVYLPNQYNLETGLLLEDYYKILKERQHNIQNNNPQSNNSDDNNSSNQQNSESTESSNDSNKQSENDEENDNNTKKDTSNSEESDNETSESTENISNNSEQSNKQNTEQIMPNKILDYSDIPSELHPQNAHKTWTGQNEDPNSSFLIDNFIRIIVDDSIKTYHQSFGQLPGKYEELIENFLSPPRLPYYEIIRKYVVGSQIGKYKMSYSRINKKRMFIFSDDENIKKKFSRISLFPSKRIDKSFNIGILLDTSMSIPLTDDGIYEALKGIESILKNDRHTKITLIQNDTKIVEEKEIKQIKDIHRISIKGRGGTNLLPGLHRFKELKTDVTIVFTDGYFRDLKEYIYSLPKKIIWVLPEQKSTTKNIETIGHIVKFPIKQN